MEENPKNIGREPLTQAQVPAASGCFKVINRLGLHARAAAVFVQLAQKHRCAIRVKKGEMEVNGKSIMGVLQLGVAQGGTIEVTAEGDDCEEALCRLGELIGNRFGEEE